MEKKQNIRYYVKVTYLTMISINILATTSSMYTGGNSETLLDAFLEGVSAYAEKSGITFNVSKINLQALHIPNLTRENRKEPDLTNPTEKDLAFLCGKIQESHGWVMANPVWNFGYPAQLKQIVDRIGFLALDYSTKKTRPKLTYMHMHYIWTCGGPEIGWWGLMRWTAAMSLGWAFRYYGAKHLGLMHASHCTPGKEVSKRKWQLRRAKRRGAAYAKRVAKYATSTTPPTLLN